MRECLVDWLEEHYLHVKSVPSIQDFIAAFRSDKQAHLILLSIGDACATSPDVLESIGRLTQDFADVPLVLLADREDIEEIGEAIRQGARGYIPTSLDSIKAAEALRFILAGGTYIPADALVHATPSRRSKGWVPCRQPHDSGPVKR